MREAMDIQQYAVSQSPGTVQVLSTLAQGVHVVGQVAGTPHARKAASAVCRTGTHGTAELPVGAVANRGCRTEDHNEAGRLYHARPLPWASRIGGKCDGRRSSQNSNKTACVGVGRSRAKRNRADIRSSTADYKAPATPRPGLNGPVLPVPAAAAPSGGGGSTVSGARVESARQCKRARHTVPGPRAVGADGYEQLVKQIAALVGRQPTCECQHQRQLTGAESEAGVSSRPCLRCELAPMLRGLGPDDATPAQRCSDDQGATSELRVDAGDSGDGMSKHVPPVAMGGGDCAGTSADDCSKQGGEECALAACLVGAGTLATCERCSTPTRLCDSPMGKPMPVPRSTRFVGKQSHLLAKVDAGTGQQHAHTAGAKCTVCGHTAAAAAPAAPARPVPHHAEQETAPAMDNTNGPASTGATVALVSASPLVHLQVPLAPASSIVLDLFFIQHIAAYSDTKPPKRQYAEPDVHFQVVAVLPSVAGDVQRTDLSAALESNVKQAIREGRATYSYSVGQMTYHLDLHAWVVTNATTHAVQPVRVVLRRGGKKEAEEEQKEQGGAAHGLPLSDAAVAAAADADMGVAEAPSAQAVEPEPELEPELELELGTAQLHVQVCYRAVWVALPLEMAERVLAGGPVQLTAWAGPDGDTDGMDADEWLAQLRTEVFIADTANQLLFHEATGHTYPFRVTTGPHARSHVVKQTPAAQVRALGDHWHWGPGAVTEAMRQCMQAGVDYGGRGSGSGSGMLTPSSAALHLRLHRVPTPNITPGAWVPLRCFGASSHGTLRVLQAYPLDMTQTIMRSAEVAMSRAAARSDTGQWPFLPQDSLAREMQMAVDGGRLLPRASHGGATEPMGRVLDPDIPPDRSRIEHIVRQMGCTMNALHVLEIVEIDHPMRRPAVETVMRVRGKQLEALRAALSHVDDTGDAHAAVSGCGLPGDDMGAGGVAVAPPAARLARACASSPSAANGNAMLLFHGTKVANPADIVCKGGPSMDHSSDMAFYGRGIYASTSAEYVRRSYAHRLDNRAGLLSGVQQMLAVVGVAGNTYNARTQRRVRMDTVRAAAAAASPEGARLDVHSCTGYLDHSCRDRNFAFYFDTDVAPAYLITFRAGINAGVML